MGKIENSICEAVDIIINKAIAEANYDKTIQAIIVSCVDETIGQYIVKYQDSQFYAYSSNIDITYPSNTSVYILIPGNDSKKDKIILGASQKLGTNYITTSSETGEYEYIGTNIIQESSEVFGLCSYREGIQTKILYSKDYDSSQNLISIDETAMNEYLKKSEDIICGAKIQTALTNEQQTRGDYGIIFALDFLDNTNNEEVTRDYVLNVDNMTGNPYKILYPTREYNIFNIDYENFLRVNYISLFCYDFPNTLPEDQCVNDIFISALELTGANELKENDINDCSLTFLTSKGTYFTSNNLDTDTITLEAEVRVQGKTVNLNSQNLSFYWGSENAEVTSQSRYYNQYLGQGWKCLNDFNIIQGEEESDEAIVEWVPNSYIYTISKAGIIAEETTFKCAVVYNETIITKTIIIKNLDSDYSITIESDYGTEFYYDIGYPTLTCLINGESNTDGYTYSWAVTNSSGTFTTLAATARLNDNYNTLLKEYNDLLSDIENGVTFKQRSAALLEEYEEKLKEYETITRVEDNIIYHLNVNTITDFSTYQCSVFYEGNYIGTSSIVLTNIYETIGTYSLVINNDSCVYKYDESGVSPTNEATDSTVEIQPLTFSIYNNLGQKIDDNVTKHCDIQWIVPIEDTLIQVSNTYTADAIDSINKTAIYKNIMSFDYSVADNYNINKNNNDIYLMVNYKGNNLFAKTKLTFLKEGESGINGSEYVCKIIPSSNDSKYLIFKKTYNGNKWSADNDTYLKVQLWHNEKCIFENTSSGFSTEGKNVSITWSIAQNKYLNQISDPSMLSIDSSTGAITCSNYSGNGDIANIVKAEVYYDDITYYATFPIITIEYNSDYDISLNEDGGFLYATYASDGQLPKYDNTSPFEITVNQLIDGYWEDVSTITLSNYLLSYDWNFLGTVYNGVDWIENNNLIQKVDTDIELKSNQIMVEPVDSYNGECLSNALQCNITTASNNQKVATIHIPIHLMLNRQGLSFLDNWDGNSIEIDKEGGFILSPQVGAGSKNSNNEFTGMIIGEIKETDADTEALKSEIGLFGYHEGKRSIFLDSSTGKAEFGTKNIGQFVIDPAKGLYQISSAGEEIVLNFGDDPYLAVGDNVLYGEEGSKTATFESGTVGGFQIETDSLWTGGNSEDSTTNFRLSTTDFKRSIGGEERTKLRLALNTGFAIDSDGVMYAGSGVLGNGTGKIYFENSNSSSNESALHTTNKNSFNANAEGFYIGTDGISSGTYKNGHSNFEINPDGSAYFSNATITGGNIDADKVTINEDDFNTYIQNIVEEILS